VLGPVVQERELADHLSGSNLDLVIVDGQLRGPFLDEEQAGAHEPRLDEDVPRRCLELEHELGHRAQVVVLEVGEHRHVAQPVGELLVHRGCSLAPRVRHGREQRRCTARVPSTIRRAILVRKRPCGAPGMVIGVGLAPTFFWPPDGAGDRTKGTRW
jgi:hypothetical protein